MTAARHFGLAHLQPGMVTKCKRKHKSIGLYVVAAAMWLVLWFMVGVEIWRAGI